MLTDFEISARELALLEQHLSRCAGDAHIGTRAAAYVVAGAGEEVLAEVRNSAAASRWHPARQQALPNPDYAQMHALLGSLAQMNHPALLVRLARVFQSVDAGIYLPRLAGPLWPEAPWLDSWMSHMSNHFKYPPAQKPVMTCAALAAMLASDSQPEELLVRPLLSVKRGKPGMGDLLARSMLDSLLRTADYGQVLARHAAAIRTHLAGASTLDKAPVLEKLHQAKADPEAFRAELVEYATAGAETLREAAGNLLVKIKASVRPDLERVAREGSSAAQAQAFRLLAQFYGPDALPFLREVDPERLSKLSREVWEEAVQAGAPQPATAPPAVEATLAATYVPLSAAGRQAVRELALARNRAIAEIRGKGLRWQQQPDLDEAAIAELIGLVESMVKADVAGRPALLPFANPLFHDAALRFVETAEIEPIHLVRILILAGTVNFFQGTPHLMPPGAAFLGRLRKRLPFDLFDLAKALRTVGMDDRSIVWWMADAAGSFLDWPAPMVAAFLARHVDTLESMLRERPGPQILSPSSHVYRILEDLGEMPVQLTPRLWNIAVGKADGERRLAQHVLEKLPDLDARITKALGNGAAVVRENAAHWLADRRCAAAIPDVIEAFRKEKAEATKNSFLMALERLGAPMERFVDRGQLLEECRAAVSKGIPPGLDWFPFDRLPALHWADSGAAVDPAIPKGLLVRTFKLATPTPGPLVRLYCSLFRRPEREALGQFVLNAWIARDLDEPTPKAAAPVIPMPAPSHAHAPPPAAPNMPGVLMQFVAAALAGMQTAGTVQPPGSSAIKQKGILAIAAACCGGAAVAVVEGYLKKWYGYRAAQCRALVDVLPWIDSPEAVQLLLSTARRFRTASIREEAESQCHAMAARKGWTMDQLGDRTIPSAGFDEGSAQELDLGSRKLTLALTAQLTVEVRTAEGKAQKDFPAAVKTDDPARYQEAKQTCADAKKSVRTVITQQTQRLYEAMCGERAWSFGDLKEFLFDHPIAGRLCQRLVWQTIAEPPVAFRPLDDGTLSDARDAQVELAADAAVRIAYGPADGADWLRHMADYEVAPLFPQLDRPLHAPAGESGEALTDFQGYTVGFFHLRAMAAKFGYQHGAMDDGPFFSTYIKRLSGLDIEVVLEFSGMDMPGENRPVVLTELRFERGQALPLSAVPRVLVSECWHDLRVIAAGGTGFDPQWKDKVPF